MISTNNSASLIPGAISNNKSEARKMSDNKKVEGTVKRPFRIKGKRLEINTVISLDVHLANEMIAADKFVPGKHKFVVPVKKVEAPAKGADSVKVLKEIEEKKNAALKEIEDAKQKATEKE